MNYLPELYYAEPPDTMKWKRLTAGAPAGILTSGATSEIHPLPALLNGKSFVNKNR